ncbi:uncharacterized protein LOC123537782 [Mercenaria mercenaria]|uniref:uncharacterized protein LOC123537782 n=1 Tax=Mercenaria mercenaria TaxID=6596 RepID=UPI00234E3C21|nr:uncharacterized protein LOC123537782 [Mercenaria mercenaria]XP_045177506.2 uncharacterized protein LOC123537782 [Mercenaria mercenaria]XP_053386007.1 uncharacterized protein LOC123537782 [Mercenaria mercenaria]XP_053386008.1 uncharacterized protein LOC123537782 [Mercenaria mercenaria]XP_053386009.1 uncharacterized protein LOC123537782 [Mercenaria mercenaria]XP_053386010.1 uncharacterized protein LOC123537782 [Mercenaria mercenaria]XP_053386011.1 uncharacterized protein LOC123537782 [Mercen
MMEYLIRTSFRAALLFCMSGEMFSLAMDERLLVHCSQTAANKHGFEAHDIRPSRANASAFTEPPADASEMTVQLCPNNTLLKFSWKMNRSQGIEMKLCYKIKSVLNGELLYSICVKFYVQYSTRRLFMTCWFPMDYLSYRPIISALATSVQGAQDLNYYGELNTARLDPTNSCKDVCEVTVMEIKALISCKDKSSILYDESVIVKTLSFDAIDSNSCTDASIYISTQTSNKLEYTLNCTHDGIGHVKVLYSIRGHYCFKYQTVRVICGTTPTTSALSATPEPDVDDFQTFVIFGLVCMIVITLIVVIINFVAQRLKIFLDSRRRFNGDLANRHGVEGIPLQTNNSKQREESVGSSSSIVDLATQVQKAMKREYIKRVDSVSSDGQGQPSSTSSSIRRQNVRKLHRCMTIALLERTESFYRKKILFLPSPFDTFSRDATSLLKAVFTLELSIPTQCCFDRDVYQKYMTCDKTNWIETVLSDYDRIVIFLCFTTIHGEARGRPMVEDMLEQLHISKSKPLCKVTFLHLTDSSENFESNHHGDSFHLSDKDSYESFISEMLSYCGRNPDTEPDLLYRLTNCETSRHFLRFIGIKSIL